MSVKNSISDYDHFLCLSLAQCFSTTLGDDLGKVLISTKLKILKNIVKTGVPEKICTILQTY